MIFLSPWAAWFLAGIPIIVMLYLLKVKRRSTSVSTLMFWQRALQQSRRRALFQRLRNPLSLLLQLLIFLLILAALAKPTYDHFLATGSSTVLILDTRARMQATVEAGQSRFEKARQLLAPYLREASERNQIALLTSNVSPEVVIPFSGDENLLQNALRQIEVTDATGELQATIRLAEQLLATRSGSGRIVVFTDHPLTVESASNSVEFPPTGTTSENLAITQFATRASLHDPQTGEVFVEIRNFGTQKARGNIEFSFDDRLLDVKPFEIEAGARKTELFPTLPRRARNAHGWLKARLDVTDALALDNVAHAVLPEPPSHRILLVTKDNWFMEKLLAAEQNLQFELLSPEGFTLSMAAKFAAVILDNYIPDNFVSGKSAGNFLFLKKSPFATGQADLEQPLITEIDPRNPVIGQVNLQNVTIVRAATVQIPELPGWSFQSPLRSFEHPLMITGACRAGQSEQRVAALAFDPAESDLPLRIAFPLLIANTVHWLASGVESPTLALRVGESLALTPDQTVSKNPQTQTQKPTGSEYIRGWFQPLHQGYYRLQQPAGPKWIAVNSFSESESDLHRESQISDLKSQIPLQIPLWQLLILTALTLSCLDWWLFHRRRIE